ncbi:MAG: SufD family Fe-S cluster assembly protein [Enterobacteriaceae bacterium]
MNNLLKKKKNLFINKLCNFFNKKYLKKYSKIFEKDYKNNFIFWNNFLNNSFFKEKKTKFKINDENKNIIPKNVYCVVIFNGKILNKFTKLNKKWKIYKNKVLCKEFNFIKSDLISNIICKRRFLTDIIELFNNNEYYQSLYILHIVENLNKNKKKLNLIKYNYLIKIKKNSKINIFENYVNLNSKKCFVISNSSFFLDKNSKLKYFLNLNRNKDYNFLYKKFNLNKNTEIKKSIFLNKAKFSKINIKTNANKKNIKIFIKSLVISNNKSLAKIKIKLNHLNNNCKSIQNHKIVSKKESYISFDNLIEIKKNTKDVVSHIKVHNLLLDSSSNIKISPKLKIYSYKSKCTHKVVIGSFNKDYIFYLRSRGISKRKSQYIMIVSFISSVFNNYIKNTKNFKINDLNIRKVLYEK